MVVVSYGCCASIWFGFEQMSVPLNFHHFVWSCGLAYWWGWWWGLVTVDFFLNTDDSHHNPLGTAKNWTNYFQKF